MKTKEAPCTSYVSEGNTCLMGHVAHHYGNCQHCKHYQARKGFRIFKKDRGLMGGAAVGQQVISQTTHVFYVNQTIATEFETGLTAIGFTGREGGVS